MPDAPSNPASAPKSRGWRIVAAGLLLIALTAVVLYTSRPAFSSPLAMVVVAAIGLAALMLQLRLHKGKDLTEPIRAPLWLNAMAIIFAIAAISADVFHLTANFMLFAALGAVVCFAISGIVILRALRKQKIGI